MRRKPAGSQYRNLQLINGRIYYRRQGRDRVKVDTGCATWTEAAEWRRAFEARELLDGPARPAAGVVPTFREVASLYLERPCELGSLSPSTLRDKKSILRPEGSVMAALGDLRIDQVDVDRLRAWWASEVVDRGRSVSHGKNSINTIAKVIQRAVEEGWVERDPVPQFRARLRGALKTKAGRAQAEGKANPIESPEDVARLVDAARAEGLVAHAFVLLLLDTGMRMAEAEALTWGQVAFGSDDDGRSRSIMIDRARVLDDFSAPPKSGRSRRVQLSRRLRRALLDLRRERFEPGPSQRVLDGITGAGFREREWRRLLKRAGLAGWSPKDLRDTFASQLLTRGINPAFVARQLGHSNWAVTAQHYARWTGGDAYIEPDRLAPGEVPADLLGRFTADQGDCGAASQQMGELLQAG